MSTFDARFSIGHAGLQLNRESENELAEEADFVVGVIGAIPVGPGQAAPFPLGALRFPMNKATIESLAEQFAEAAKHMKEPSKLEIANSLDGVDQATKFSESLKG